MCPEAELARLDRRETGSNKGLASGITDRIGAAHMGSSADLCMPV